MCFIIEGWVEGLTWKRLAAALVVCFVPERGRGWTFFRWREREAKHCRSGGYENRKERTETVCLKLVSFHSVLLPVVFSGPCCGQCHCVCEVLLVLNWAHCWPVESEEGGGTACRTPCRQVCPAEAVFLHSFCSHAGKDRWSMNGWDCDGTWKEMWIYVHIEELYLSGRICRRVVVKLESLILHKCFLIYFTLPDFFNYLLWCHFFLFTDVNGESDCYC